MVTEVIELQTLTPPTNSPSPMRSRGFWWKAAAGVVVAGGVMAAAVALLRDDSSTSITTDTTNVAPTVAPETTLPATALPATTLPPTTVPPTTIAPTPSTFAGATLETFPVDLAHTPYFVAAYGDPWVSSLAGEMVRLDPATGEIVARRMCRSRLRSPSTRTHCGSLTRSPATSSESTRTMARWWRRFRPASRSCPTRSASRCFKAKRGVSPRIGGLDSDGESVWVGDRSGGILRIDAATNTIAGSFDVSVRPDHLRFDGEHVLVANLTGGDVAVIDAASGVVIQEITGLNDLAGAELYGGALYFQDATDGTVNSRRPPDRGADQQRRTRRLGAA